MRLCLPLLLVAVATPLACGASVQRAALSPAIAEAKAEGPSGARRLVVKPPESRVVVAARDVVKGSHRITFDGFRGTVRVDPAPGQLRLDIDTTTLRGETPFVGTLAQSMLEAARFPHATLVARLEPATDAPDTCVVTGNVTVHGVEHGITFRAKMKRDGDALHMHAVFDMSRSAFGIKADSSWDPLIRDELRVTFDLRGLPEPVDPGQDEARDGGGE